MKSESQVIVRPARNVRGSVSLPGDKSISHRYAMLAAHRRWTFEARQLFDRRGLCQHTWLPALTRGEVGAQRWGGQRH